VAPKCLGTTRPHPEPTARNLIERDFDSAWGDNDTPEIFVVPRFVATCRPSVAVMGGDYVAVKAGCQRLGDMYVGARLDAFFEIEVHSSLHSK
jgi:hypothetical protein